MSAHTDSPARPPAKPNYDPYPDYTRPLLKIPEEARQDLWNHLRFLYGEDQARKWLPELERIIKVHYAHKPLELIQAEARYDPRERFSERDMVVITYGDMVKTSQDMPPLAQLARVCDEDLKAINTIHLLPFFPYSSDRGFSVTDFTRVDPRLGTWENIRDMAGRYELMFDGVLNHASSRSQAFQEFLNGNPKHQELFIAYDSPDDLTPDQRSKIFRPRTSDILTRFDTLKGVKYLWTTFSDDQIDFNYRNPEVLMRIVEGILFYVRNGADIIRLDAVTYIWAEPGTECVHLPQTHEVVKLLRSACDLAAPGVALITETNVPHEENISYFGNGFDEAHMVYNFALPPMVLYTFYTQQAGTLSRWAAGMEEPSDQATFFNILDTHDGIGLMGTKGILSPEEIQKIIDGARQNGALVSYKSLEGGSEEPYEINSTWWSAINGENDEQDLELKVRRYVASRSISLMIQGVPAVYIHGAIGSSNDWETYAQTNHKRDLNRALIEIEAIKAAAQDPDSKISRLGAHMQKLNLLRVSQPAFHPHGAQRVLDLAPEIFALKRTSPQGDQHLLALTNVSDRPCPVSINLDELGLEETVWRDLVAEAEHKAQGGILSLELSPYQVAWLCPAAGL